jgi:hypothetical protein
MQQMVRDLFECDGRIDGLPGGSIKRRLALRTLSALHPLAANRFVMGRPELIVRVEA